MKLKVCLAAVAAFAVAGSAHASTSIFGELYLGADPLNYYLSANGGVPQEFSNKVGNPVVIDDGAEFGYIDSQNLDAADFTGTTLTILDVVYDDVVDPGAVYWTQKFTTSSPGLFAGLALVSSNFDGLTYSVTGDTLTVNWAGTEQPGYFQADFSFNGVPEPATWSMMITGFGLAGMALRRRRGLVAA